MSTLAELLEAWRIAADLSQEEASARCKMPRSNWGMIEQGHRTRLRDDTFRALAEGTGMSEIRLRQAAIQSLSAKLRETYPEREEEAVTA